LCRKFLIDQIAHAGNHTEQHPDFGVYLALGFTMSDSLDPDAVEDAASFLVFARALLADRELSVRLEREQPSPSYRSGHCSWENGSIEGFLEAAISWAEDSNFGQGQGIDPENPWRQFAVFLYCGKIYE